MPDSKLRVGFCGLRIPNEGSRLLQFPKGMYAFNNVRACVSTISSAADFAFDLPLLDYTPARQAKHDVLERFEASIYRWDSTVKAATA